MPPVPMPHPQREPSCCWASHYRANDAFRSELALASTREANALLANEPPSSLRARALADLARDLFVANDPAAIEASQAAIDMAVEVGDLRTEALARGRIALSRAQRGEGDVTDAEAAMRIARTTRDPFVVLSVYFNVGYLFDTLGDPARAGEILADEGLPLVAELGLPTVALSAHAGWYLWQAGRWDAGRRVVALAARDGQVRSGRNLVLAMTQALFEAVNVAEAGVGPEPTDVEDAVPWLIAAERAIWDGSPERGCEALLEGPRGRDLRRRAR